MFGLFKSKAQKIIDTTLDQLDYQYSDKGLDKIISVLNEIFSLTNLGSPKISRLKGDEYFRQLDSIRQHWIALLIQIYFGALVKKKIDFDDVVEIREKVLAVGTDLFKIDVINIYKNTYQKAYTENPTLHYPYVNCMLAFLEKGCGETISNELEIAADKEMYQFLVEIENGFVDLI